LAKIQTDGKRKETKMKKVATNALSIATLLAVVVFLPTSAFPSEFILMDNETLDVWSYYDRGTLWDYSSATIRHGGAVVTSYVNDFATLNFAGGWGTEVYAYHRGTVRVSAGFIERSLVLNGNSSLSFSGGEAGHIQAYGNSSVTFSDGKVNSIGALESSSLIFSGGEAVSILTRGTSNTLISGGGVNHLTVGIIGDNCSVDVSGGTIGELYAYAGTVKIYGTDFRLGSGLSREGIRLVGTGLLGGKWLDGTSWSTMVVSNQPAAYIIIPEPSGLLVLASGLAGLGGVCCRTKRRK